VLHTSINDEVIFYDLTSQEAHWTIEVNTYNKQKKRNSQIHREYQKKIQNKIKEAINKIYSLIRELEYKYL